MLICTLKGCVLPNNIIHPTRSRCLDHLLEGLRPGDGERWADRWNWTKVPDIDFFGRLAIESMEFGSDSHGQLACGIPRVVFRAASIG